MGQTTGSVIPGLFLSYCIFVKSIAHLVLFSFPMPHLFIQVQGVGTALKILFSSRKNGTLLHLSRTEIIALFNVLGR